MQAQDIQTLQTELAKKTEALQTAVEERDKKVSQLNNLQHHLLNLETQHDHEGLLRDDQSKDLEQKVGDQQRVIDQYRRDVQQNDDATKTRINISEARATEAMADRDRLRSEFELMKIDKEKAALGLGNLEMVLQGFESEKEAQVASMKDEMAACTRTLQAEIDQLNVQVAQAAQAAAARSEQLGKLAEIQGELNLARGMQKSMEMEKERMQRDLSRAQANLAERIALANDRLIDKQVIANMFVSYCEKSGEHQQQVLLLIASALSLDQADRYAVGIRTKRGFFESIMQGPQVVPETPDRQSRKSTFVYLARGGELLSSSSLSHRLL